MGSCRAVDALVDPCAGVCPLAARVGDARGASSGGRDVGPVVGLRGVSVALRRLARREFGATGFWNRDALVALAGRVLGLPACVGDG